MAWLSGWSKRVKLTIDQNDIDATQAWLPVRVHLGTSVGRNSDDVSFVFDELQNDANRKKIAVTKADGTTQLYVEIEKWDDANEEAEFWVSRDGWEIADDADTELYLYYDSTHADNTDYVGDTNSTPAEAVWRSALERVDHMQDGADNAHTYDSTNHDVDSTKKGANEPIEAAGKVALAQDFDGSDDYLLSDVNVTFGTGEWAVELILKAPNQSTLYASLFAGASNYSFAFNIDGSDNLRVWISDNGSSWNIAEGVVMSATDICDGADHYMVLTRRNNTVYCYIDGIVSATTIDMTGSSNWTACAVQTGVNPFYAAGKLDGIVDEIRCSSTGLTAAWIKATKESLWDDLLAFGSEELPPAHVPVADGDLIGIAVIRKS